MTHASPAAFCHIVIPAPDLTAAKRFYEGVFAWTVHEGVPGPQYWFFESGGVGGAFSETAYPARGSTVLVLRVEDIAASVAAIRDHGGTITQEPSALGDAASGRDAYFLDPNGNEMGLYTDR